MKKVLAIVVLLTLVAMVPVAEARRCGPKFIDTDTDTHADRAGRFAYGPEVTATWKESKYVDFGTRSGYEFRKNDSHWYSFGVVHVKANKIIGNIFGGSEA